MLWSRLDLCKHAWKQPDSVGQPQEAEAARQAADAKVSCNAQRVLMRCDKRGQFPWAKTILVNNGKLVITMRSMRKNNMSCFSLVSFSSARWRLRLRRPPKLMLVLTRLRGPFPLPAKFTFKRNWFSTYEMEVDWQWMHVSAFHHIHSAFQCILSPIDSEIETVSLLTEEHGGTSRKREGIGWGRRDQEKGRGTLDLPESFLSKKDRVGGYTRSDRTECRSWKTCACWYTTNQYLFRIIFASTGQLYIHVWWITLKAGGRETRGESHSF